MDTDIQINLSERQDEEKLPPGSTSASVPEHHEKAMLVPADPAVNALIRELLRGIVTARKFVKEPLRLHALSMEQCLDAPNISDGGCC